MSDVFEQMRYDGERFYCLTNGHAHTDRTEEALCSALFQINRLEKAVERVHLICQAVKHRPVEIFDVLDVVRAIDDEIIAVRIAPNPQKSV